MAVRFAGHPPGQPSGRARRVPRLLPVSSWLHSPGLHRTDAGPLQHSNRPKPIRTHSRSHAANSQAELLKALAPEGPLAPGMSDRLIGQSRAPPTRTTHHPGRDCRSLASGIASNRARPQNPVPEPGATHGTGPIWERATPKTEGPSRSLRGRKRRKRPQNDGFSAPCTERTEMTTNLPKPPVRFECACPNHLLGGRQKDPLQRCAVQRPTQRRCPATFWLRL